MIVKSDNLKRRDDGRSVCFGLNSDKLSCVVRISFNTHLNNLWTGLETEPPLFLGCNLRKAVDTRNARHTDIQITCVLKRGVGYLHSRKQKLSYRNRPPLKRCHISSMKKNYHKARRCTEIQGEGNDDVGKRNGSHTKGLLLHI